MAACCVCALPVAREGDSEKRERGDYGDKSYRATGNGCYMYAGPYYEQDR